MESNAIAPFTVSNQQVLQPPPTRSAIATGSDYLLNQTNLILIVAVITIAVVAFVSLVYFKKRKKAKLNCK